MTKKKEVQIKNTSSADTAGRNKAKEVPGTSREARTKSDASPPHQEFYQGPAHLVLR